MQLSIKYIKSINVNGAFFFLEEVEVKLHTEKNAADHQEEKLKEVILRLSKTKSQFEEKKEECQKLTKKMAQLEETLR